MGYYLVDYENVKKDGLNGINLLTEHDKVCIFYSENSDTLTFDLHRKIIESRADISFQKVDVGTKNALDFQLATCLGYMIREKQDETYYIVTKDKGFQCLCTFWEKMDAKVQIVADVSRTDTEKNHKEILARVQTVIEEPEIAETVARLIQQYKTKQGINNALMKKFPSKDNKQGSEIYKVIKPLLTDKKGK